MCSGCVRVSPPRYYEWRAFLNWMGGGGENSRVGHAEREAPHVVVVLHPRVEAEAGEEAASQAQP